MMTPAQMIDFYEEQAASTATWAEIHRRAEKWAPALHNYDHAAQSRLFRALLGWRTGLLDPVPDLRQSVEVSEATVAFLDTTDVGPLRPMFDPVPGAYCAILLGQRDSPVVVETRRLAVRPTPRGLTVDRALEGWLIGALLGRDPGAGPEVASGLASQKRMALVGATYSTYFALAALSEGDGSAATDLTRHALELFRRRRSNGYYSGGVQYEGGGPDNDLVVDYHLAAIWRYGDGTTAP